MPVSDAARALLKALMHLGALTFLGTVVGACLGGYVSLQTGSFGVAAWAILLCSALLPAPIYLVLAPPNLRGLPANSLIEPACCGVALASAMAWPAFRVTHRVGLTVLACLVSGFLGALLGLPFMGAAACASRDPAEFRVRVGAVARASSPIALGLLALSSAVAWFGPLPGYWRLSLFAPVLFAPSMALGFDGWVPRLGGPTGLGRFGAHTERGQFPFLEP